MGPPLLRSIFGIGVAAVVLKGIKEFLEVYDYEPDQLHFTPTVLSPNHEYTLTKSIITTVTVSVERPEKPELDWPTVIDFLFQQLDKLDPRIPAAILGFLIAGPVLIHIIQGRKSNSKIDESIQRSSTQTSSTQTSSTQAGFKTESTQTEEVLKNKSSYELKSWRTDFSDLPHQYNPAERAWLQFGKSKSESVLLGLVPRSYESEDLPPDDEQETNSIINDLQEQKQDLNSESKQMPKIAPVSLSNEISIGFDRQEKNKMQPSSYSVGELMQQGSRERETFTSEESITVNPFDKRVVSSKSLSSLSSSRSSPIASSVLHNSHNHLIIQMMPTKTDTQISSDLAYSQPFSY